MAPTITTPQAPLGRRRRPRRFHARRLVAGAVAAGVVLGAGAALPAPAEAVTGGIPITGMGFVAEVRNTASSDLCTGSLITPSWVLTAVHCAYPASVGDVTVRVGNTNAKTDGQFRTASRILRNPAYTTGHNDVALIQLSEPVGTVSPVSLADPGTVSRWDGPDDLGHAVGWGLDDPNGHVPDRLMWRDVSIRTSRPDDAGIPMIPVGPGPCRGDSGGPLLVAGNNGGYVQAGVLKGAACGSSGSYSDVGTGPNRSWITSRLTGQRFTPFGLLDWDRDGHQDIVARDQDNGDLMLYPGQSVRGYSAVQPVRIGNGWRDFTPLGTGDWDRDGFADIVARLDRTGEVFVYFGRGVRGYSGIQPIRVDSGAQPYSTVGVSDWDRDGNPDLIVRDNGNGDVTVLPGNGTRGQRTAPGYRILGGMTGSTFFGAVDYDRDGHQDLVARQNDSGDLFLYPGTSVRGPNGIAPVRIGDGWSGRTPFGLADYDRDGHQDIVTRDDTTRDLALHPGRSVRGYSGIPPVRIGNGW